MFLLFGQYTSKTDEKETQKKGRVTWEVNS